MTFKQMVVNILDEKYKNGQMFIGKCKLKGTLDDIEMFTLILNDGVLLYKDTMRQVPITIYDGIVYETI